MSEVRGHAFICYVREDKLHADHVQSLLEAAGIPFWRDTESLWPGEDWRLKIREAITQGAFAFIPIFSSTSVAKGVSGQNEELYLAAEEMRRRQPGVPWMIPVRFDDCEVPKLRLAAGDTLDSIQRADLFGDDGERQGQRLVEAVGRIIQGGIQSSHRRAGAAVGVATEEAYYDRSVSRSSLVSEVTDLLRDPGGDIRLFEVLTSLAEAVHDEFADPDRFPVEGALGALEAAEQVESYWRGLDGLLNLLVVGGAWTSGHHSRVWGEVVERVGRARGDRHSGNTARLALRWFPNVAMLYAGGLAAVRRRNFDMLRVFALDAQVRDEGQKVPLLARAHPWRPFRELPVVAQVLALQESGEVVDDATVSSLLSRTREGRHTPVSDMLHDHLRPKLRALVPDDADYSELFDEFEVLLGLLSADLNIQWRGDDGQARRRPWVDDPHAGRFTWRDRHSVDRVDQRMLNEFEGAQEAWPPLKAGLFGGSVVRVRASFDEFNEIVTQARRHQF